MKHQPINNQTVYREACKRFLPTTLQEMQWKGWGELDVLLINGDAYVDHPTFGDSVPRSVARKARTQSRHYFPAQVARTSPKPWPM
jgi:hypothetical protein